jgi:hypothetical protein
MVQFCHKPREGCYGWLLELENVVENLYWNLGKWHWHGFKNLEVGIFKIGKGTWYEMDAYKP